MTEKSSRASKLSVKARAREINSKSIPISIPTTPVQQVVGVENESGHQQQLLLVESSAGRHVSVFQTVSNRKLGSGPVIPYDARFTSSRSSEEKRRTDSNGRRRDVDDAGISLRHTGPIYSSSQGDEELATEQERRNGPSTSQQPPPPAGNYVVLPVSAAASSFKEEEEKEGGGGGGEGREGCDDGGVTRSVFRTPRGEAETKITSKRFWWVEKEPVEKEGRPILESQDAAAVGSRPSKTKRERLELGCEEEEVENSPLFACSGKTNATRIGNVSRKVAVFEASRFDSQNSGLGLVSKLVGLNRKDSLPGRLHRPEGAYLRSRSASVDSPVKRRERNVFVNCNGEERSEYEKTSIDNVVLNQKTVERSWKEKTRVEGRPSTCTSSDLSGFSARGFGRESPLSRRHRSNSSSSSRSEVSSPLQKTATTSIFSNSDGGAAVAEEKNFPNEDGRRREEEESQLGHENCPNSRLDDLIDSLERIRDEFEVFADKSEPDSLTDSLCSPISEDRLLLKDHPASSSSGKSSRQSDEVRDPAVEDKQSSRCSAEENDARFSVSGFSVVSDSIFDQNSYRDNDDHAEESLNRTMDRRLGGNRYRVYDNNTNTSTSTASTTPYSNNGFYRKHCARLTPHLSVKAVTKVPPPQPAILYHPEPREERYPYEYYEEEDDNDDHYYDHYHSSPKVNSSRSLVRVKPELPAYLSLGRNKGTTPRAPHSPPDVSYDRALVLQEENELVKIREILSGLDFSKYRKKPVNRSTSDCPPQLENKPNIRRSYSSNYPLSQPEKSPLSKTPVTRVPNNVIPEYSGWGTNKLKELTRKLKPQMVSTAPSSPNLGLPKPTSPFSKKFSVTKRSFSYSNFDTVPEQGGPLEPVSPQSFRQNLSQNSLVRATATLPRRKPGIVGGQNSHSPYSLLNPLGKERHCADYLDLETRASDTRQRNSALFEALAGSRPKFVIGDSDSREDRSEPATPEITSSNFSPWSLLRRQPSTGQRDDQDEPLPDAPPGVPERRKRKKALGTGPTVGFQMSDRNYSKSDTGRSLTYPLQNQITAVKESGNYDGSRVSGRLYGRRPASDISTGVSGDVYGDSFKSDALEEQMTQDSFESGSIEDRYKSLKKKHHSDPGAEKPQLTRTSNACLSELMASSKSEPYLGEYTLEDEDDSVANEDASVGKPSRITGSQTLPRRETPNRSVSVSSGTWTKGSHRRYGSDGGGGGPPTPGIYSTKFPDSESDSKSPLQQRRYYKKRLRGPYGEMLEEEMRKYGAKLKNPLAEETSDPPVPEKSPGNALEVRRRPATPGSNQALEDPELKRSNSSPGGASVGKSQVLAKRKVSANIPLLGNAPSTGSTIVSSSLLSLPGTAIASLTHSSEPSLVRQASSESGGSVASATSGQLSRWSGGEDDKSTNEESWRVLDAEKYSDTRTHVVGELYDTEHSYVESLQILVNKYMKPLKSSECANMVDSALVDEIFYQIPEILNHHESFLELLRQRLTAWDTKQIIGDVFVEAFTKQPIVDTYTAFINNWKSAKEAIKLAVQAKPAFAKFLEHMSREHKGKLPLDALLIMPVQRIPRYELLIKELLKHTQLDHPDHQLLIMAQKEVHDLAVKINRVEREAYQHEQMQQRVKDIEHLIEGVMDLVQPDRTFNRFDIVAIPGGLGKKERCFFLFSDLLLITSIKRKSGTIRKSSNVGSQSPYGTMEMNKYKLLMRFSLDNLDIAKCSDSSVKKIVKEIENLEEDLSSLNQISDIASSLHCSHQSLDDVVRDMIGIVNKQLIDKQTNDAQLLSLDLTVTTQEGIDNLTVIFPTADKRASWEESFNEAKQKLALSTDRRPPPEFMYPLPIRKTRAGLQFTCSASTLGLNSFGLKDVWVCNSDGYVGQVCVLSLQPEPTLTSCNGVCNARILCAMSIPAAAPYYLAARRKSLIPDSVPATISIHIEDADIEEEDEENCDDRPNNGNFQLDSESSEDDDESTDSPVSAKSNSAEEREEMDNLQPTMWLGTEDGCIHVYNCNDNIRIKKNKMKIQHSAAVHCIIYLDNRVFVSLANGELVIYKKDTDGGWNTLDMQRVQVGSASSPVLRMLPVAGKLWCGCQNNVKVLNTLTLEIEKSFLVCSDSSRPVICLVTSGLGVWIAIQHSAILRLFHATSYTNLLEVNVAPAVTKMLSGCDNIIRQHKAACLRVTALLACKDLLWVGTSAGVILTLPLPHLTSTTTHLDYVPNVAGVPHGHTGHVRFLTYVEMSPGSNISCSKLSHRSVRTKEGLASRRASTVGTSASGCRFIVLSGGDGYENFQNLNTGLSEGAGHDDSTNHLLLWQV